MPLVAETQSQDLKRARRLAGFAVATTAVPLLLLMVALAFPIPSSGSRFYIGKWNVTALDIDRYPYGSSVRRATRPGVKYFSQRYSQPNRVFECWTFRIGGRVLEATGWK